MISVLSLGSGSSGNSTIIDDGKTVVLVDCGVSHAVIASGLASLGRAIADLAAVLVSHEHTDHIRSLDRLARQGVPIVCTAGTARAAGLGVGTFGRIELGALREVGSLAATSIPVCHDAAEPCGFLLQGNGATVAIVTDAGCATNDIVTPLEGADLIIIESNHDERMLRRGPYPAPLKRRVLSDEGHLSNDVCSDLLARVAATTAKRPAIWLAHLSAVNNRPDLAVTTVVRRLHADRTAWSVEALPRAQPSRVWRSDQENPPTPYTGQLGLPGLD
ncbi:MAG: MBL fold metallo-hydrolase [Thermomicrobiales bacterium]